MLRGQADISPTNPMPTERSDDSATVGTATAETLTWFYLTAGAWASATGQAAATLVWGKLTYKNVLNSNKAAVGGFNNTSLSLGAATRFDTLVSVPEDVFSRLQFMNPTDQKAEMLKYLTTNGYYAIDHRRGEVWGVSKAVVANDTTTYNYWTKVAGSSDITSIVPGTGATNLGKAEDAVHASGDVGVMALGVANEAQSNFAADGDYTPIGVNRKGTVYVQEVNAPVAEDNTRGVIATASKPDATGTYAWSIDKSAALEASSVTKASAGALRSIAGRIDSTHASGTYYYQVYNATSLPADGAVTFLIAPLKLVHTNGTDTNFNIDCTMNTVPASTGIVEALSTTEFTKTISGAFLSTNVLFV